ncbi:MAG: outer membrane beta-barrel protein [Flavobacteriia bacterium]|nr:outer membrane beta-barrel protein [Flavobacteriia bacterium]
MKRILTLAIVCILALDGHSQSSTSADQFKLSGYLGYTPSLGWSGASSLTGGVNFQYQPSIIFGVSFAIQVGTSKQEVGSPFFENNHFAFCATGVSEFVEYRIYHVYPRVNVHPLKWAGLKLPLDIYAGAGYGYFFNLESNIEETPWDLVVHGGVRYAMTDTWSIYLETGYRDRMEIALGASYSL